MYEKVSEVMKKNVYNFINKEKVKKKIKELRDSKSEVGSLFTLQKLSREIGITPQQISAFEKGKKCPTLVQLLAYSKYFKVSLEYILCLGKAHNYTHPELGDILGLSDKVINTLKNRKKNDSDLIDIVNQIVEVDCGFKLLEALKDYFYSEKIVSTLEKNVMSIRAKENKAAQTLSDEPDLINDIMEVRLHRLLADIKKKINNNLN